jgi:hypothetical protein
MFKRWIALFVAGIFSMSLSLLACGEGDDDDKDDKKDVPAKEDMEEAPDVEDQDVPVVPPDGTLLPEVTPDVFLPPEEVQEELPPVGDVVVPPEDVEPVDGESKPEATPEDAPVGEVVIGEGACTNEADLAALQANDVYAIVPDCAMGCLAGGGEGCVADCVQEKTGISDACAQCFQETVDCTLANCLSECLADPNGAPCAACQDEKCGPAFDECSGLNQGEEPPPA